MRAKIINGVAVDGSAACVAKSTLVTHRLPQSCQVYLSLGLQSKRAFNSGVTRPGGRRGGFGPRGTGLGEGESGGGIRSGRTGCGRDGAGVPGLTGCGTLAGRRSGIFSGIFNGSSVFGMRGDIPLAGTPGLTGSGTRTGCGRDGAGVPGLTGCGITPGRRSGIFSGISIGSSVFGMRGAIPPAGTPGLTGSGRTGCGRDGAGVPGLTGFGILRGITSGIFSGMSSSSSVLGSLSAKRFAPDRFASHLIAHPLTFMAADL